MLRKALGAQSDIQCLGRTSHEKETMMQCASMLYPWSQMMPDDNWPREANYCCPSTRRFGAFLPPLGYAERRAASRLDDGRVRCCSL